MFSILLSIFTYFYVINEGLTNISVIAIFVPNQPSS